MKDKLSKIKDVLLLNKYQSLENIKKLCSLVGFTNVITCIMFYYLLITSKPHAESNSFKDLLIVAALTHIYINIVLINWSLKYEGVKWVVWAWISLIFISPLGVMLIYQANNPSNWTEVKASQNEKKQSIFHSFANSFVNLPEILNKAIDFLTKNYPEEFSELLDRLQLSIDDLDNWNDKDKYFIIAIHEALKQTKKKNTFKDIDFEAHWYDQRYFDFAVRDPKSAIVPNLRYRYSLAFIVLDEFNNYQKILDAKKEIKANMKFGTAKTVCLKRGKGFKVYVNE